MIKHIKFTLLIATVLAAANSYAQQAPANSIDQNGKLWASLWQQKAAEYRALCFQAYNFAHLRAEQALLKKHKKPLAIVTDIDETLLDNSPNAVQQALLGKDYDQAAWLNWTSKAQADTVPGAPSFFKYAASKGIAVFYITNRSEKEREATIINLKKYGLPYANNAHLMLRADVSSKEVRRQEVSKTHQIIMLCGDNLADFSSLFDRRSMAERLQNTEAQAANFGKLFIVLPNATYGDWEGALYNYNYKLTPAQKEEIIKKELKNEQ